MSTPGVGGGQFATLLRTSHTILPRSHATVFWATQPPEEPQSAQVGFPLFLVPLFLHTCCRQMQGSRAPSDEAMAVGQGFEWGIAGKLVPGNLPPAGSANPELLSLASF